MGRYSYSQPSSSEAYPERSDSGESETEDLIRRDQAEIELQYGDGAQYPPQPEMEFGFPQTCYCGGEPRIAPSRAGTGQGRLIYTCDNIDDGECHIWKYWDVAVMEEMTARENQLRILEEKVENVNLMADLETEEKVVRLEKLFEDKVVRLERLVEESLAKKKSSVTDRFEVVVGVMLVVVVVIGVVMALK